MNLPNLTGRSPTRRQEITFGGLNLTDGARAGELRACDNVSTRRCPVLSPRRGRRLVSDDGATSVFEWDGKLVKVVGTSLYYGSDLIGSVTSGEKQFAVVNTKLCIWPDKVYIDLTNRTLGHLDAEATSNDQGGSVLLTGNSLKAALNPAFEKDLHGVPELVDVDSSRDFPIYTYGTDKDAVEACCTDGVWDADALAAVVGAATKGTSNRYYTRISAGDIIIPGKDMAHSSVVHGVNYANTDITLPDTDEYNSDGYYGVVTALIDGLDELGKIVCFDLLKAGESSPLFSRIMKVGDVVDISGTLYGLGDVEKAAIRAIDDGTNTLTFTDGTFFVPIACAATGSGGFAAENAQFKYDGVFYLFTMVSGDVIPEGNVVCLVADGEETSGYKLKVWDPDTKKFTKTYSVTTTTTTDQHYDELAGAVYDPTNNGVTVKRPVPDFNFICESNNRLWGVSNSQENTIWNAETNQYETFTSRVIYASALGEPGNFWAFEGLSTDAWQVAVGSEGDFTGLCAYDGVLAWKEQKLYRISGSYPAEYYMFDRDVEGVQKGSGKSLTVIDETLYYKGRDGVYAYRGGAPQLVSSAFGNHRYGNAVAGNDGQRLYISMKEGDVWGLYVYDTMTGLWAHEDGTQAAQFCRLDGKLLLLTDTGMLLELDNDGWKDPWQNPETGVWSEKPVTWSAVFAPFDERDMHERKYYLRILLRTDIGTGGDLKVYVKAGHDDWHLTHTLDAGTRTVVIPIFPYRIDELMVKLEGTGNASVLSLAREYTVGSIYGKEGVAP